MRGDAGRKIALPAGENEGKSLAPVAVSQSKFRLPTRSCGSRSARHERRTPETGRRRYGQDAPGAIGVRVVNGVLSNRSSLPCQRRGGAGAGQRRSSSFPSRLSDYAAAGLEFDEETVGGRTSPLESPSRRPRCASAPSGGRQLARRRRRTEVYSLCRAVMTAAFGNRAPIPRS